MHVECSECITCWCALAGVNTRDYVPITIQLHFRPQFNKYATGAVEVVMTVHETQRQGHVLVFLTGQVGWGVRRRRAGGLNHITTNSRGRSMCKGLFKRSESRHITPQQKNSTPPTPLHCHLDHIPSPRTPTPRRRKLKRHATCSSSGLKR